MVGFINGAGGMQLQDNELWEALESKLIDEGLLRYFTLNEQAQILASFANAGRGSDELLDQLEKIFIKHRKALIGQPETLRICRLGFDKVNKGSEILKRVLHDPSTPIAQIE